VGRGGGAHEREYPPWSPPDTRPGRSSSTQVLELDWAQDDSDLELRARTCRIVGRLEPVYMPRSSGHDILPPFCQPDFPDQGHQRVRVDAQPAGFGQHGIEVLLGELLAAPGAQLFPSANGDEHADAAALLQDGPSTSRMIPLAAVAGLMR